jgi:ComF family protein
MRGLVHGWLARDKQCVGHDQDIEQSHAVPMSARAEAFVTAAGRAILDLALPPRCAACSAIVADDGGFCPACWASLTFLGAPACARCDLPFAQPQGEGALCGACIADPPPYERVHTPLAYGAVSRQVVMRLKYGRRTGMARMMARMMAARLPVVSDDAPAMLLVPVPLHRWRLWSRGFNQSVEVARYIAQATGHQLAVDALARKRATPVLRGMGRTARDKAVRGAFIVPDKRRAMIKGRAVILIDDVFTTGSTVGACARTLLRAGAARVEIATFARVISDMAGDVDPAAAIDSIGFAPNIS